MHSRMAWAFAVLLGLDESIRNYVEDDLEPGEERELPGGKIRIRKVYNRGFLLNRLQERPDVVRKVSLAAGAPVILYWISLMFRKGQRTEKLGSTLMAAGAAGNLYDRIVRGRVVDYIGVSAGHSFLSRLTANLADLYLLAGSVLLTLKRIL